MNDEKQPHEFDNLKTETGAQALADRIAEYWEVRGYKVRTWLDRIFLYKDSDRPLWCVRSDLVNGLPTARAIRQ